MTTNINFSFTRLMAVMKRDMMENWKTNIYRLIACYSGAAMAFLFGMYGVLSGNRGETGEIQYTSFCNTFHSILSFVTFFYLIVCKNNGSDEYKKQTYLVYDASGYKRRKVHKQSNICMHYFYGNIFCGTVFC